MFCHVEIYNIHQMQQLIQEQDTIHCVCSRLVKIKIPEINLYFSLEKMLSYPLS